MIPPETLRQLWIDHSDRLLLVARSMGEPAEDAVQEAFVRLATQSTLPDEPVAWLVRVIRNQIAAWHREGVRRRHREQARSAHVSWFPGGDGGGAAAEMAEVTAQLRRLPDDQRQIIVMHLWGNLTFRQIAVILDSSRSSVHRRYQQALDQLRAWIDRPPGDHACRAWPAPLTDVDP
jgi:RNA polymerase sigma factor (sigma-70 family)